MSNIDRLSLALDQLDAAQGAICIFNAQPRPVYEALRDAFFKQKMKPLFDRARQMGLVPDEDAALDLAIVEITRNKIETQGLLAQAYLRLRPKGVLIVNGNKTDGVESHLKSLRKIFTIEEVISKAHGKVFWIRKAAIPELFDSWIANAKCSRNVDGFVTCPGIFSAEHIDNGSYFLNECLPSLVGRIADLGAGWGYLARAALAKNPGITEFDLIEADRAALACARQNVEDQRAQFHWADALRFEGQKYDAILMNPPFHQSRRKDETLGESFIQAAARLLDEKGELWMVANRQLAYEDMLKTCFSTGQILHQSSQYKIIRASKPKG